MLIDYRYFRRDERTIRLFNYMEICQRKVVNAGLLGKYEPIEDEI